MDLELGAGNVISRACAARKEDQKQFAARFWMLENLAKIPDAVSEKLMMEMGMTHLEISPAGKPLRGATRGLRALNIATLRRHLQRHGADLEEATLGPCEGPKGLGMYARRPITKGEVVASVPRGLVLEAPLLGAAPPSDTLPLAAAAGGHGQWYDVLGSASGRRSAVKLAKRVVEEEEKGPKVGVD
eukprot:s628_g10.t2